MVLKVRQQKNKFFPIFRNLHCHSFFGYPHFLGIQITSGNPLLAITFKGKRQK